MVRNSHQDFRIEVLTSALFTIAKNKKPPKYPTIAQQLNNWWYTFRLKEKSSNFLVSGPLTTLKTWEPQRPFGLHLSIFTISKIKIRILQNICLFIRKITRTHYVLTLKTFLRKITVFSKIYLCEDGTVSTFLQFSLNV